ncbi:hypothetical protein DNTS_022785 [Danionella cerebrum]|uniref:Uncharacterized protein n=1 Tax=Danionella cerebrum TaxID=2873325 RepID=A0A553N2J5_9TELE|nr:hypothetical protein DNTS_022785 [Danionella translucida]
MCTTGLEQKVETYQIKTGYILNNNKKLRERQAVGKASKRVHKEQVCSKELQQLKHMRRREYETEKLVAQAQSDASQETNEKEIDDEERASPRKRRFKTAEDSVEGFLHNVSPRKQSKNNVPFFTAEIQSARQEYHRVVVFSIEKQASFTQAEKNGNAVRLRNVKRSISFSDPGGYDILCSAGTSVEAITLPFVPCRPASCKRMTIAEVKALGPKQKVGEVRGQVQPDAVTRTVVVNGVDCELKEVVICDSTGQMTLTLWDRFVNAVEGSKSYAFKNVSTRERQRAITLSTGPSSLVEEVADMKVAGASGSRAESTSKVLLSATVKGIEVCIQRRCSACHARQEAFVEKSKLHRCEGCKLKQAASAFVPFCSGKALVTNSALCNYLRREGLADLLLDSEAIEEHLLESRDLTLTVNEDRYVEAIERGSAEQPLAPQQPEERDSSSEQL